MIYIKDSTSCTRLAKNYDSEIRNINEQITQLNSNLYVDLKKYFTVNYGWEVFCLNCTAISNLVCLVFMAHPSNTWTPNKMYTVLNSTLPKYYRPYYDIYAPGLDVNGDSTSPNVCAFNVSWETGDVRITTGEKNTNGYFYCNLTYILTGNLTRSLSGLEY